MKIFKWYLISELDLYIYQKSYYQTMCKKIKYYENENWKQYQEIERLKEENKALNEFIDGYIQGKEILIDID